MTSKKRKINVEESVDENSREVTATEEVSHNEESNDSLREQEDERYTPAANN